MYNIQCSGSDCGKITTANDIIAVIYRCLNKDGWIVCESCGERGIISSWFDWPRFSSQESDGDVKKIHLKAVIKLNRQPPFENQEQDRNFVFLLSFGKDEPPDHFCPCRYHKDDGGLWRVYSGPIFSLMELGVMVDHLERPDGEWGLGVHVPRSASKDN